MDINFYKDAIKQTMQVINTDADSVVKNAEQMLKEYLETNTSITDNDKAALYAKFLTDTTTNALTQTIMAALQLTLEGGVNDQKILNMQGELAIAQAQSDKDIAVKDAQISVDNQKIASMQAEDTARRNEVAAKVAKAKIEIEQLIPSQIALNEKEIEIRSKDLLIKDQALAVETKKVLIMDKDIALKDKQVSIEEAKLPLMRAQAQLESRKVDLMGEQVNVERRKVPLMEAQAQVESKKVSLMEAQIEQEREKLPLLQKQVDVETAKIPLMQAQASAENAKIGLITEQTEVEKSKVKLQDAEVELRFADVLYRQMQAQTVQNSLIVNERIEARRNETQIKIATIQAAAI